MELIKITEQNGKKVVSARELHAFLVTEAKGGQIGEDFSNWIKRYLDYLDAKIDVDYTTIEFDFLGTRINKFSESGSQAVRVHKREYALSIDLAKQIAMVQNNDKGKQARLYFIECEKQLTKPMSQIDILVQSVQLLQEQSKRIDNVEAQLLEIKNKPQINAPIEHFSIMGYCRNIHRQISIEEAKIYGAKCRKMCNELGMVIGKVPDPRFGSVNTYPLDVLNQIIKK